jgi:hypothetical protein
MYRVEWCWAALLKASRVLTTQIEDGEGEGKVVAANT